jgi:ABC-type uncharacterized transport system substrate-binding protein
MRPPHALFRRRLLQGIAAALAAPEALAQTGKAPRRVGVVFSTDPPTSRPYLDALVGGIRQHGHRLERDYVVEARHAEGRPERYPALVREILDARAEVIVVGANSSVLAAKAATSTVPVVMAGALDPDSTGLVASLARPGGNVTGIASMGGNVTAKRLQLLRELVPGARRIAYLTSAEHRLPASYAYGEIVREGGLTSYASSLEDTFRMAGTFVGRILGGAKPAELPVEQPTRYELLVNAKTAGELGLAIPSALRAQAELVD